MAGKISRGKPLHRIDIGPVVHRAGENQHPLRKPDKDWDSRARVKNNPHPRRCRMADLVRRSPARAAGTARPRLATRTGRHRIPPPPCVRSAAGIAAFARVHASSAASGACAAYWRHLSESTSTISDDPRACPAPASRTAPWPTEYTRTALDRPSATIRLDPLPEAALAVIRQRQRLAGQQAGQARQPGVARVQAGNIGSPHRCFNCIRHLPVVRVVDEGAEMHADSARQMLAADETSGSCRPCWAERECGGRETADVPWLAS